MKQTGYPIKDSNVLSEVQDTLLHNFRWGSAQLNHFSSGQSDPLTRE